MTQPNPNDPNAGAAITPPPAADPPASPPQQPTESNTALLLRQLEERTIQAEELRQRVAQLEDGSRAHGGAAPSTAQLQQILARDVNHLTDIAASDEPLAPFARVLLASRQEASSAALTVREEAMIDSLGLETAERREFATWFERNRDHFSGPQAGYDAFLGNRTRRSRTQQTREAEQAAVNASVPSMPSGGAPQTPPVGSAPQARSDGKQVVAFSWYVKNVTQELMAKKDRGDLILDYSR